MADSLEVSTKAFIADADWLENAIFEPLRSMLLALAQQIDASPTNAALWSQYGLAYRSALKAQPEPAPASDPLDAILRR